MTDVVKGYMTLDEVDAIAKSRAVPVNHVSDQMNAIHQLGLDGDGIRLSHEGFACHKPEGKAWVCSLRSTVSRDSRGKKLSCRHPWGIGGDVVVFRLA
jgi:hypothetical protein